MNMVMNLLNLQKAGNFFDMLSIVHRVSKRSLQLRKSIQIYSENIHNVLKCQNVAKHIKFYLG
jgi:hypothetical protein